MLVATLLIFLQLGFYYSVPAGGTVFYDALQFDVVITGSDYVSQGQPNAFPRRRIYQSMALPEVKSVAAVYQGKARWDNEIEDVARDVFVMGFNPNDGAFRIAEIEEQLPLLTRPDSILIDRSTRREFGPLEPGRLVEINQRAVQIIGDYRIGTGFLALGAAITSDLNFIRTLQGAHFKPSQSWACHLAIGCKSPRGSSSISNRSFPRTAGHGRGRNFYLTSEAIGPLGPRPA